jgi:hypothetical protein
VRAGVTTAPSATRTSPRADDAAAATAVVSAARGDASAAPARTSPRADSGTSASDASACVECGAAAVRDALIVFVRGRRVRSCAHA